MFTSNRTRFPVKTPNITLVHRYRNNILPPLFNSLSCSLFSLLPSIIQLIDAYREITRKMQEFIVSCRGNPGVYIHGPRGVGKSYSLYEVVCTLRSDPSGLYCHTFF